VGRGLECESEREFEREFEFECEREFEFECESECRCAQRGSVAICFSTAFSR
jgi:hypothetical protein